MSKQSPVLLVDQAAAMRAATLVELGIQGPLSRAQLARQLGVSPALMTSVTKQLLGEGLIRELEETAGVTGRPARLLDLRADAGRAIGVKVGPSDITCVSVSVNGHINRTSRDPYEAQATAAVSNIVSIVDKFIQGEPDDRLLGIGVGVPGTVDQQSSGSVDSWQLGWSRMPIGSALQNKFNLPVFVENNVNGLAHAERLFGEGRRSREFLMVTLGTGIGAAIVREGVVQTGATGAIGEIGHFPTDHVDKKCTCGGSGCLEAVIGERALLDKAISKKLIRSQAGIENLVQLADSGNEQAQRIFSEAGHILGRFMSGLVHTVDPEVIYLSGEGTLAWEHWSLGFEPAFRETLLPSRRGIRVHVEPWRDENWAQGAAALVLTHPREINSSAGGIWGADVRRRLLANSASSVNVLDDE